GRGAPRPTERIGDGARTRAVLGGELPRTGGALGQLPLVAVQVLQVPVTPLRRRRGPYHLQAAGDGVLGLAAAVGALPAQPLLLDRSGLRLGTDQGGITRSDSFAEDVAADDERGGFPVVHRHPAECLTDGVGRGDRIRLAFGAFGIDV